MPVFARNCVATSHPLAAQAGLEMMRAGGNAVDAAVAMAISLTVLEPTSNGMGSDCFSLVWFGGGLHGLNASGRAPMALDRSRWAGRDKIPTAGWDGVTTPGAVSGWVELSRSFGALPFEKLCEPAIRYAREGAILPIQIGYYWGLSASRYLRNTDPMFQGWRDTFAPGGEKPRVGHVVRLPDHARSLEEIARTRGESFYHGELAEKIDAQSRHDGGFLRKEDLAAHQPDWVRPIHVEYRGYRLHEIPPNGQGLVALIALGILRQLDLADLEADSVQSLHVQIEAMKLAFADGHRYIADPEFMDVRVSSLLDDGYLKERSAMIDRSRAQDFDHGTPKEGGTIYLTAADDQGNMVSYIQSNYTGFGSGIVVPGTGMSLQNRGCCFTLEEGHPNIAAPGKRPYHTIIPAFLTRARADGGGGGGGDAGGGGHEPVMSFGVMGGFMQPQGHAQVVVRLADFGQNPQAALDAPRWQVSEGLKVSIEPGFDDGVYEGLSALGHEVSRTRKRSASHGRGQAIWRLEDGYLAASDLRSDGQAVGF